MLYVLKNFDVKIIASRAKTITRRFAITSTSFQQEEDLIVSSKRYKKDINTNVIPSILDKTGRQLLHLKNHPLKILRDQIQDFVHSAFNLHRRNGPLFTMLDNIPPVVTLEQNFDNLLMPERSKNDHYYILNNGNILRTHTSAHLVDLIRTGLDAFLFTGDVYRRDEIDRNHYPVFHQMDGVRLFSKFDLTGDSSNPIPLFNKNGKRTEQNQAVHTLESVKLVEFNLKQTLTRIVENLGGENLEFRWVDICAPWAHPSWELEIYINNEWLEVLGCGILEQEILNNAGASDQIGWSFGIGLDRLAMCLFNIPDIRLFWSEDPRFLEQFEDGRINKFKPFSKYPPTYKDLAFGISEGFSQNDLYEVVRNAAGDIVEKVEQIDSFIHPKTREESQCYRITYRSMDKTFAAEEINAVQEHVREELQRKLQLRLR